MPTFPSSWNLRFPYYGYWQYPDDNVFENAPSAVEDVHSDDVHTPLGIIEKLRNVPEIGDGVGRYFPVTAVRRFDLK